MFCFRIENIAIFQDLSIFLASLPGTTEFEWVAAGHNRTAEMAGRRSGKSTGIESEIMGRIGDAHISDIKLMCTCCG